MCKLGMADGGWRMAGGLSTNVAPGVANGW